MNSRSTLVLVCAVVFAGFTGCRHAPADDPLAARKIDGPPAATPGRQLNQVVILDREVTDGSGASSPPAATFTVERQGGTRLPNGALEVYATFRNRTDLPLELACRTRFLGLHEEPVEGPAEWQRVPLPPRGLTTFKGRSLALTNVEYFNLEVRENR